MKKKFLVYLLLVVLLSTNQVTPIYASEISITATETGASNEISTMQLEMITLINKYRADNGLSPLVVNAELSKAADARAVECLQSYAAKWY